MVQSGTVSLSHHRLWFVRGYDGFYSRYWPRSLLGASLSCLAKKVTKEATRGEALSSFPIETPYFSELFSPEKTTLSSGLLSRRSALVDCFFLIVFYVALRQIFQSVPLGAHIHALRMQGASCRRRITTHDSGLHLAHHRWVHHSLRGSAKLRFVGGDVLDNGEESIYNGL